MPPARSLSAALLSLCSLTLSACSDEPDSPPPTTPAFVHDGGPSWSPDGSQISFHSDRDGNGEIYVMKADGSDVRRLTDQPSSEGYPCFSPDGSRILFDSDRTGNFDLWVMNSDGSDPIQLTKSLGRDLAGAWSPDGRQIAFMSDRVGAFQVYVMDAKGGNVRRMTSIYTNWFPRWSPDGTRLAFHVRRDVHVMSVDATSLKRLTTDPENGMYPTWSPDGAKIAFMSWRDGDTALYTMAADGSDQVRLTSRLPGDCIDPRWSPTSSLIAFVRVPAGRDAPGPQQIWLIDPLTLQLTQLTGR